MSALPSMAQLRVASYGLPVANAAKVVPSNTIGTIYTVTGGRILLTSLLGVVSTAIVGTPTLSVGATPSGGASAPTALCTATSISGAAVGTALSLPDLVSGALAVAASGVIGSPGVTIDQGGIAMVSAGVITTTTSAAATGAISWLLTYLPLDSGAVVTAA
jgi:hypothetical protein